MQLSGRALTRHSAWNALGLGAPLILAIVAVPVLLNGLGEVRLGVLGLAWMVLSLVSEIGVGRAVTRFAAAARGGEDEASVGPIVALGAKVQLGLGLAVGVGIALLAGPISRGIPGLDPDVVREAERAFWWIAAGAPAVFLASAYRGGLEALQRFGLLNVIRGTASSANFLIPVVALWLGWGLTGIVALLMGSRVLVTVALRQAVLRSVKQATSKTPPVPLRALLRFGGWSSVSSVLSPMLTYLDRALLAAVAGAGAVGRYTPPWEAITRLSLIPSSVVNALFPVFAALSATPADRAAPAEPKGTATRAEQRTRTLALKGGGILFVLTGVPAAVLALGAEPLLSAWLGAGYHPEGARALQLLAPGVVLNATAHVPYAVLLGVNRPDVPALLHAIQLPVLAVATWFLVSAWGVPGAALAWTLRSSLDALGLWGFMFHALKRRATGPRP